MTQFTDEYVAALDRQIRALSRDDADVKLASELNRFEQLKRNMALWALDDDDDEDREWPYTFGQVAIIINEIGQRLSAHHR